MTSILCSSEGYVVLSVPEVKGEAEEVIRSAFSYADMVEDRDYLFIPLEEGGLYREAIVRASEMASKIGSKCSVVDETHAVVVFSGNTPEARHHLRLVWIIDKQSDPLSVN